MPSSSIFMAAENFPLLRREFEAVIRSLKFVGKYGMGFACENIIDHEAQNKRKATINLFLPNTSANPNTHMPMIADFVNDLKG